MPPVTRVVLLPYQFPLQESATLTYKTHRILIHQFLKIEICLISIINGSYVMKKKKEKKNIYILH